MMEMMNNKMQPSDIQTVAPTLDCMICCMQFDAKSRLPKNLKCGHMFCGDCIGEICRCPLCNVEYKRNEVKTNFNVLAYIEKKQEFTTICKHSGEPEELYCLDCKEITCNPCASAKHDEHTMTKPKQKTLMLRKSILQLADEYDIQNEVLADKELSSWRDEWIQQIKDVQQWELSQITDLKETVVKNVNHIAKLYTDLINNVVNKLLSKVDSIWSPSNSLLCNEKIREMLDLINKFELNGYKEVPTTTQAAEEFLARYKVNSKPLTLKETLLVKDDIGSVPNSYKEIDAENLECLVGTFLPELIPEQKSSEAFLWVKPPDSSSQYCDYTSEMQELFKLFNDKMKTLSEEKQLEELLAK